MKFIGSSILLLRFIAKFLEALLLDSIYKKLLEVSLSKYICLSIVLIFVNSRHVPSLCLYISLELLVLSHLILNKEIYSTALIGIRQMNPQNII